MSDYLRDRVTVAVGTHYLIEGEIGRGGMAVVYRAVDLRLHRNVAIKVLPPDLAFNADVRTRFLREAQTAAQLNHPNVVPIYAVDETEGLVYFVMAFVEGESLAAMLARQPLLPYDRVARILREVADGLAYAHDRGVIHRDIKPDNILIDRASGRAVLTDFGIARAAAETRLTVSGIAVGTPAYMSPEQAMGEAELDGRADIYSLGVVGYQMLAGEPPFRAANTPAMLMKHVSEPPRPLRDLRADVPATLAMAVERSLAKKPADRWPSAHELRDILAGDLHAPAGAGSVPGAVERRPDENGAHASGYVGVHIGRDGSVDIGRGSLPPLPVLSKFPKPPMEMSPHDWRQWSKVQRHAAKDAARAIRHGLVPMPNEDPATFARIRVERLVTRFRRSVVGTLVWVPGSFVFAVATHMPPFFFVPTAICLISVIARAGGLWAEGINPFTALRTNWRKHIFGSDALPVPAQLPAIVPAAVSSTPAAPPRDNAADLVPSDVFAGSFGSAVRRAADDRATILDVVSKLKPVERELLPHDVEHTANAITERVASLAVMLHRLDADVSGASLAQLDRRIDDVRGETATADRDRHLTLLERQRKSLHDLLDRRRTLANQLESASLLLQNLKFDLLKLRSAGVASAFEDATSVTQEARALSRDISHLLDAADEVKKL